MSESDYENVTSSFEEFRAVKHNESDYESFRKFQDFINSNYSELEKNRSKKERAANVKKWDSRLPTRWKGSNLRTIENSAGLRAEAMIKKHRWGSIFIKGEAGSGKTFLSYAIARRYIGVGWVTPSEVKIVSEEEILLIAKRGFTGQEVFTTLMSPQYKLWIFDNVGNRSEYDKRERPMWEQLINHIYENSFAAIFTSVNSAVSFSEKLTGPAASKFRHLIENKIIEMKNEKNQPVIDDYDEKDLERDEKIIKNNDLFGNFED